MPFGADKREFTTYVKYVFLILGLVELLILAIFLSNLDALVYMGLEPYDLFITAIFNLIVAAVIHGALDKVNITDFEISILLLVIAFLDLIIFHNFVSALLAILLFIAASGFIIHD